MHSQQEKTTVASVHITWIPTEKRTQLKLSGMWGPVLGFPVQSRQRHTGYILAKGQEDDLGTGASLIWTETERAGNVQHRGEKTQGNLSNVHEHLRGGCKKLEPGSFQWCPMTGSEIMENKLKHRSVLLNIRKPCKSTQFIASQTLMKNIKSPRLVFLPVIFQITYQSCDIFEIHHQQK